MFMKRVRRLMPLLLVAAMLLCGLHACAEVELVPGMLMAAGESFSEGTVPGSEAWREGGQRRATVSRIEFLDSLADAPEDAWDMSALGDRSVLGWRYYSGDNDYTVLYIAAEGGVKANPDSSYLFAGYGVEAEAVSISLDGSFDSSTAENLTGMFQGAQFFAPDVMGIEQLDTSGATCMAHMFENCFFLSGGTLSLQGMDTSSVEDMSDMFRGCVSDREDFALDLSAVSTAALKASSGMFADCGAARIQVGPDFDADKLDPNAFDGCRADGVSR